MSDATFDGNPSTRVHVSPQVNLRDHFAGLAMQAMLSKEDHCAEAGKSVGFNSELFGKALASASYSIADAMLARRAGAQ